jgi:hypothetical protein
MGGRNGGRKRDPAAVRRAVELRAQGLSLATIAYRLAMSVSGVQRILIAGGHYYPRAKPGRPPPKEK